MSRSFAAFGMCLVGGIFLYPALIGRLARWHAGQQVQDYSPRSHAVKAGTPTMGGILFCALAVVAWLALDRSRTGFLVVFALCAGGAVGLLDDLANVRGRGALGLLARQKLVLQAVIGICLGLGLHASSLTRQVFPGMGAADLGWAVVPVAALAVIAVSNAVNLTDGVDGLAGICSALVMVASWALALHVGNRPAAVLSAALAGGVLAFLVYNWWPARVFMGDTGSLALGCATVAVAGSLRLLWLLPLLGVVFVAETVSVIVNVTAITRFGRRLLRASPLHHHFEEMGLREERVVLGFAAVAAAGALVGALVALPAGIGS
jgi:phospho-N-acetylmuramoyl-pentapeptide-transferase